MKKVLTIVVAALCAALVYSCKEDQPTVTLPTATLSADESFVGDKANITVTLSVPAPVDVTATIAYGTARSGKTAIALSALKFDETVTLKAGEKTVSCVVELLSAKDLADGAEAPIALAAVSAGEYGTLKCDVNIAYITYKAGSYNGGDGPNDPGNNGDLTWTLQTDWTAEITGTELESEQRDDYTYYYIQANLTAPGSTYVFTDSFADDAEFAQYGGTSIEDWAKKIEAALASALEQATIDQCLYTAGPLYLDYYGAGDTFLYVIDFDANGKLTGKYAKIAITMPEFEEPEEPEEPSIYDVIGVNGTGDALFTFDIFSPGEVTDENLEDSLLEVGSYPAMMAYVWNSMLGSQYFEPYDFMNEAEYNTAEFKQFELGRYDVVIVGLTEEGNLTGEYNISTIEVDGREYEQIEAEVKAHKAKVASFIKQSGKEHFARKAKMSTLRRGLGIRKSSVIKPRVTDENMVLQENWSVKVVSEVYTDDDGDEVVDVELTLPGIKYYDIEENTQEDLDDYYDGTVAGLAQAKEASVQKDLGQYSIDQILYSGSDPQPSIYVYNPGIETTIYVIEFDEEGHATGRYGATVVVMPEGVSIEEPEVTIIGPITKNAAWQAEYLGRYEEIEEEEEESDTALNKKTIRFRVR